MSYTNNSKNKILIVVPSISGVGGAEKTAVLLGNALSDYGFNITIAGMTVNEPGYPLNSAIEFLKIDNDVRNHRILKNIDRVRYLLKLSKKKQI